MDSEEFRKYGKEMIDFVADYWDSLNVNHSANQSTETVSDNNVSTNKVKRKPLSDVKPGYIWDVVPTEAPKTPESWQTIFADLEPIVLRGNTHWHHPDFFAYFPTSCSYPAIIGDILSGGIASIGFSWNSSPAMTELEMAMTDWLAKAIGLPDYFYNIKQGNGAGIIQNTASDATFVALLSARARAVDKIKSSPEYENSVNDGNWIQSTLNKAIDKINIKNIVPQKLLASKMFSTDNNTQLQQESKQITDVEQTTKDECKTLTERQDGPSIFRNHDPAIFQRFVAYCSDQAHSSVEKDVMLCGVHIRKLQSSISDDGNFTIEATTLEAAIQEDKTKGLIPFVLIATIGTTNTCGVDRLDVLGPICARESIWMHVDAAYAGSFLICDEFRYLIKGIEYVDSFNFNAHKALMINFDCSPLWIRDATNAVEYFKVDPLYLRHAHQKDASDYRGDKELNEKLTEAINSDGRIHLVPGIVHGNYFLRLAVCSTFTRESNIDNAYKVIKEISEQLTSVSHLC